MAHPLIARLSDSQKICLLFAASGMTSKEIAPHTGWTHKTIDQYSNQGTKLLQLANRRDAGRFLLRHIEETELKEFQLKFPALVRSGSSQSPLADSNERTGLSRPSKRFRDRLKLSPLGGRQNDLDLQDKLTQLGISAAILTISGLVVMMLLTGALKLLV